MTNEQHDKIESLIVDDDQGQIMPRQLLATISVLAKEISSLNHTIENRLSYDKTKEEAFDRLYAELDDLKKNSAFDCIRPLYIDLILLFDRIESFRQDVSQSSNTTSTVLELLGTLSDELLEILSRREVIISAVSHTFEPIAQHAIGIELTADESENNQVARVVRRGFRYRGNILRTEEVIVKRFSK